MLSNPSRKWCAFIGIALLSFGAYLDYTVVNIALPVIQIELKTDLNSLQWVMNIYFLALCVLATIMGRCGDLYGRRRLFYMGAAVFGLASILAGLAPNIHWLIAGRLLQGVGAAIVFPLGPSLLPESFPEHERAKAIAWLGGLGGVALAAGPVLGGLIVASWGWRWIFFINVPLMLLGYVFCAGSVKESAVSVAHKSLDWRGAFILAVTMSGIVLSLIRSADTGWSDAVTLMLLGLGIAAGVVLVIVERHQQDPLIDFKDFSNPLFFAGAALGFLSGVLSAVTLFFDPLYLQIIRSQSPQVSGLILFAIPVTGVLVALLVGWFIRCFGAINTIIIGILAGIVATLLHAGFAATSSLMLVVVAFICLGVMWAMGNTVAIIATQTAVGAARASVATATNVTMFNIGGSVGLAIAVVIYHAIGVRAIQNTGGGEVLNQLIANPANFLKIQTNALTQKLFSAGFMQGFAAVMWFLLITSSAILLAIFIGKMAAKRDKVYVS